MEKQKKKGKINSHKSSKSSVGDILSKAIKQKIKLKNDAHDDNSTIDTTFISNDRLKNPNKFDADSYENLSDVDDNISNISNNSSARKSYRGSFELTQSSYDSYDDRSTNGSIGSISITSRSIGNKTFRSYSVDSLTEYGTIEKRDRTMRELVKEIEIRSRKNLRPPIYVPKLEELTADKVSWHAKGSIDKLLKKERKHKLKSLNHVPNFNAESKSEIKVFPEAHTMSSNVLPPIDILGCHHPAELILFKADQRARKLKHTMESKCKNDADYIKHIDQLITEKFARHDRNTQLARMRTLIKAWIHIIHLIPAPVAFFNRYQRSVHEIILKFKIAKSAEIIQRAFRLWYRRLIFRRYHTELSEKIGGNFFHLIFNIRIARKRRAVKKVLYFLDFLKNRAKVSVVVGRFLKSVRKIQKFSRSFLSCKNARIEALARLWDKIEFPYIKKILKERAETKVIGKATSFEALELDKDLKIEMEKQYKRWVLVDKKMNDSIQKHREAGNLKFESHNEAIYKLMAPSDVKVAVLNDILRTLRRESYLERLALYESGIAKRNQFSEEDAITLLLGNPDIIQNKFKAKLESNKLDMASVNGPLNTFVLFRKLDKEYMFNRIKQTHDQLQTFALKLPEKSKRKQKFEKSIMKREVSSNMQQALSSHEGVGIESVEPVLNGFIESVRHKK